MSMSGRMLQKQIGSRPRDLVRKEARQAAVRRAWNREHEKIIVKEGGRHINLYQLWNRHPVIFVGTVGFLLVVAFLRRPRLRHIVKIKK